MLKPKVTYDEYLKAHKQSHFGPGTEVIITSVPTAPTEETGWPFICTITKQDIGTIATVIQKHSNIGYKVQFYRDNNKNLPKTRQHKPGLITCYLPYFILAPVNVDSKNIEKLKNIIKV